MKEISTEMVTLDNLCGGGAAELFAEELKKVLENIMDPNTEISKVRKIVIEVRLAPERDGKSANVSVLVNSKLAPINPTGSRLYFGVKNGKPVAVEYNPQQLTFDAGAPKPVAVFPEKGGAG